METTRSLEARAARGDADGDGVIASPRWARYWMRRAAALGNRGARRWLRANG